MKGLLSCIVRLFSCITGLFSCIKWLFLSVTKLFSCIVGLFSCRDKSVNRRMRSGIKSLQLPECCGPNPRSLLFGVGHKLTLKKKKGLNTSGISMVTIV